MSSARRGRFHGKPFGGNASQQSTSGVSDQLIKNGRKSGQLNLSSRGLSNGSLLCVALLVYKLYFSAICSFLLIVFSSLGS